VYIDTILLRATIQNITAVPGDPTYDPDAGNITNATVSFVNRENIGSASGSDYIIGVVVNGYYTRNSIAEDMVVVVSKPTSNFITA
jgi:hypothetical protein